MFPAPSLAEWNCHLFSFWKRNSLWWKVLEGLYWEPLFLSPITSGKCVVTFTVQFHWIATCSSSIKISERTQSHLRESLIAPSHWKDDMTKKMRATVVFPLVEKHGNKGPLYLKRHSDFYNGQGSMEWVAFSYTLYFLQIIFLKILLGLYKGRATNYGKEGETKRRTGVLGLKRWNTKSGAGLGLVE